MKPGTWVPALLLATLLPVNLAAGESRQPPARAVTLLELDILRQDLQLLTVLDIRPVDIYREGHIPWSFPVDVTSLEEAVLSSPTPDPARILKALGKTPLKANRAVVIYDARHPGRKDGWMAWLLSYAGVETVQILDGGFAAWNRHKALGVYQGYPMRMGRMELRAEGLTPRPHLRVDPGLTGEEPPDGAVFVTVLPAGSQDPSPGQIAVHEVLNDQQYFLYPVHLETLLKSRGLDPEDRLLLRGEPADAGLVWAALVGNGLQAAIVMRVSPPSPQPPAP